MGESDYVNNGEQSSIVKGRFKTEVAVSLVGIIT